MHVMVSWKVRKIECNLVQYYYAYKLTILSKLIKYIHVQVLRNMSLYTIIGLEPYLLLYVCMCAMLLFETC
jgi:hypothetical protein